MDSNKGRRYKLQTTVGEKVYEAFMKWARGQGADSVGEAMSFLLHKRFNVSATTTKTKVKAASKGTPKKAPKKSPVKKAPAKKAGKSKKKPKTSPPAEVVFTQTTVPATEA